MLYEDGGAKYSGEKIIGVRAPEMRKLAKEYSKNEEAKLFLNDLPHKYYDENLFGEVY